jgi:uncharacterized protein (TIGR00369 family)
MPLMTVDELEAFIDREFPQAHAGGRCHVIEAVGPLTARVRLEPRPDHLRPGGTLSGPAMMTLADYALYIAVLAQIGPVALTVTTSLTFNFLRKPAPRTLLAECRLLKLGRTLAVGEIGVRHPGEADLVCHATGTYAIPRQAVS